MRRRTALATAALLALTASLAEAQTDYDELYKEYSEAQSEHSAKLRELYNAGDQAGADALRKESPVLAFVPRFQEGAREHAETDAAIPFLGWLVTDASRMEGEGLTAGLAALETLAKDHAASEAIGDFVPRLARSAFSLGVGPCVAFYDRVAEAAANDGIRANALYGRGYVVLRNDPTDAQRAAAMADMRRVLELDPDSSIAERAAGQIFEAEYLQIGMIAPDIEGEDLDGVKFKLSDYRGKVVVLDFWGDW